MNKLSEKTVQNLIDIVSGKPGLYDRKHPMFKKTDWKERTWKEIGEALKVDNKNDCKMAWKSLRDQFAKCLKDMKVKKGQARDDGKKPYKYFDRLLFLKDTVEPRRSFRNYYLVDKEEKGEDLESEESRTLTPRKFYLAPKAKCADSKEEFVMASSIGIKTLKRPRPEPPFEFEACIFTPTTSSVPQRDVSPSAIPTETSAPKDIPSPSADRSETPTKKRRADDANEMLSRFFEQLVSKFERKEADNLHIFFQSVANTVNSFQLTNLELASLQAHVFTSITQYIKSILEKRKK